MRKTILLSFLLALAVFRTDCFAQQYTYNHDPMKQAQITVMESGTGTLTPEWYYSLLHENYSQSAAVKNKTKYRIEVGTTLYSQRDYAERIDSAMSKRAAVEALNMADRAGGSADLAWAVEGDKLREKMASFKGNIDKVVFTGGSVEERDYWQQFYGMYSSAIRNTQDAYMPNSQRKREYLRIYQDVCVKNELLVKYLVSISSRRSMRSCLDASAATTETDKMSISQTALSRWKSSIGMGNRRINED